MTASLAAEGRLVTGFADPVHDSQRAFRSLLQALSRPGRPVTLGVPLPGLRLGAALSRALLCLADEDTPVWWQHDDAASRAWLRFHTGAPACPETVEARFAIIEAPLQMPPLAAFSSGTDEAPEGSTTLLIELPSFDAGTAFDCSGPGILDRATVRVAGLPERFWAEWELNHGAFPQGVDIVFTCGDRALGLPRTTRARRADSMGEG
ncbi:MAG: phosphonate C-P lyase system protein PhnH [Caldimonas sp.]